jgi:hypothetical protein
VLAILAVLTAIGLSLAIYNVVLIVRKNRQKSALDLMSSLEQSNPAPYVQSLAANPTDLGSTLSGGPKYTAFKNKALAFFYLFSLIVLTLCLFYFLRVVPFLYNCFIISILRQLISILSPCIGYCYLSNW